MKKNYEQNMKEIKELVNNSEHMIVITDRGFKIECDKLNLLSMTTLFLRDALEKGFLNGEDIKRIVELALMSDKRLEREIFNKFEEALQILKSKEETKDE